MASKVCERLEKLKATFQLNWRIKFNLKKNVNETIPIANEDSDVPNEPEVYGVSNADFEDEIDLGLSPIHFEPRIMIPTIQIFNPDGRIIPTDGFPGEPVKIKTKRKSWRKEIAKKSSSFKNLVENMTWNFRNKLNQVRRNKVGVEEYQNVRRVNPNIIPRLTDEQFDKLFVQPKIYAMETKKKEQLLFHCEKDLEELDKMFGNCLVVSD